MINIASPNSNSQLSHVVEADIQPNAVDIRVDKIFESSGVFVLTEDIKIHRSQRRELEPYWITYDGKQFLGWTLNAGYYEFTAKGTVAMAEDEAGYVIVRSTLNRNGVFITSGLYDSGYEGVMAGALHVTQPMYLGHDTRIGQFVLMKAEALSKYDGSYGLGKDEHLYKTTK